LAKVTEVGVVQGGSVSGAGVPQVLIEDVPKARSDDRIFFLPLNDDV